MTPSERERRGIVYFARCPEHGLHGCREECFVCGGPVEQVPMVSATWDGLLGHLVEAAREVDAFLGDPVRNSPCNLAGFPERWRFGGTRVEGDVAVALLCLHDCLNDLSHHPSFSGEEGTEG